MAGADKKKHTRSYIEEVTWQAHQSFVYGFLDQGDKTLDKEIEIYTTGQDKYKFEDDLIPALVELVNSQELKNLIKIAESVVNRLPKVIVDAIMAKIKEEEA